MPKATFFEPIVPLYENTSSEEDEEESNDSPTKAFQENRKLRIRTRKRSMASEGDRFYDENDGLYHLHAKPVVKSGGGERMGKDRQAQFSLNNVAQFT